MGILLWLRGEPGTRKSAKFLRVGSAPTGASIPDPIPEMTQGLVVPPFDINITKCEYCGRKLSWKLHQKGGTIESYKQEQKLSKETNGRLPLLVWGPPYKQWSYGCPKYGNDVAGPLGWHDYWWEKDAMYNAFRKELTGIEI